MNSAEKITNEVCLTCRPTARPVKETYKGETMNVVFWTLLFLATFTPRNSVLYRDVCNLTGFSIGAIGLTLNGGFPAAYDRTRQGQYLVMSGIFAYVAYYTAKDEIKIIKDRKKGIYWK